MLRIQLIASQPASHCLNITTIISALEVHPEKTDSLPLHEKVYADNQQVASCFGLHMKIAILQTAPAGTATTKMVALRRLHADKI